MGPNGGVNKWGVNYLDTYLIVVNWMYVRDMLTLSFFLAYTQDDVKKDIFMELPIYFGV